MLEKANNGPVGQDLLAVSDLAIDFTIAGRPSQRALDGVELSVAPGEFHALVGESGSGKSTLARSIIGTLHANASVVSGDLQFQGKDLLAARPEELRRIRGASIGFIPQDALLGLNPLLPVGRQVAEPLRVHGVASAKERKERVLDLFERVALRDPLRVYDSYPHELSGGMCQRALIAAAISTGPRLLVADEPTSALDVTVQRRILDLISELSDRDGLAVLMITHDLNLAAERSDRITVLKDGRVEQSGAAERVVRAPASAYARELIDAAGLGGHEAGPAIAVAATETLAVVAEGIEKSFPTRRGGRERTAVLKDVSVSVPKGSTLGVVGESGSGKTTLIRVLAGLTKPDRGTVTIAGRAVTYLAPYHKLQKPVFRTAQLVYQNPFSALDPRTTIETLLDEPLTGFTTLSKPGRQARILELIDATGLPRTVLNRYTAELSGGQRQRVAIARALAPNPEVLLLDEPVSALDVTIQAQILKLLVDLQRQFGLTYVFVSHDLGVIRRVAQQVVILDGGVVVESGPAAQVFDDPKSARGRELIEAIPRPEWRSAQANAAAQGAA